ncbi:MAG: hypothetical protein OXM03_03200 [Chloroflexota bacterium]|nr:hypothetical protein [Chloroflexota bacterium]
MRIRTTVLPGSKVEIVSRELPVLEDVDVVGGLVFKTATDVAAYLKKEKASWHRCATTNL